MLHMLRGQKRLSWFGCGYAALWIFLVIGQRSDVDEPVHLQVVDDTAQAVAQARVWREPVHPLVVHLAVAMGLPFVVLIMFTKPIAQALEPLLFIV